MLVKNCNVCQLEKSINDFEQRNNKPTYRCKDCVSIYNKKYYQDNQEKLKNNTSVFRSKNPNYMKQWRKNNSDKVKQQKKNWYIKNSDKINTNERHRRKIDPQYKIKKNLRRRVNQVITRSCKIHSTLELLGCSLCEFMKYFESKFVDGMSWENYGLWHIDHIIPCSSFDLTDPEQQRVCFNYTNLQPLWAIDNLKKSDIIL